MRGDHIFILSLLSMGSVMLLYYGSQSETTVVYDTVTNLKKRVDKKLREVSPECCKELSKECFACSAGLLVQDFCKRHRGKYGCPGKQEYDCSSIIPNGEGVMTRTKPPFKMFIHPVETDIHVSGSIKRGGVWEHSQINLFTNYLKEYPSAMFIDVGLNIGMYGLVAAANKHKVIAFEPLKLNLNRVCSTINFNKFTNIQIYPYAITNSETKVSFKTPKTNAGGTSVTDQLNLTGEENVDYAFAYTFDSFNIVYDGPILMKIDIEGHECQMFEQIKTFFSKNDVKLIMIEWGQLAKKCGNKIADILLSNGLMPYNSAGNVPFKLRDKPWKNTWDMVWKKITRVDCYYITSIIQSKNILLYPETERRLHKTCPSVSAHIVSGSKVYDGVIETLLNSVDGSPFCTKKEEDKYLRNIGLSCNEVLKTGWKTGWKNCKPHSTAFSRGDALFSQLKRVVKALGKTKYIIGYGTLLGIIRDQDMNKNEVDNDIIVSKTFKPTQALITRLRSEGLIIFKDKIYRICEYSPIARQNKPPWDGNYVIYTDIYNQLPGVEKFPGSSRAIINQKMTVVTRKLRDIFVKTPDLKFAKTLFKIRYGNWKQDPTKNDWKKRVIDKYKF